MTQPNHLTRAGESGHLALPSLAPRPTDAHKGNFGRVLIVAGSRGMTGAAGLAGLAALRAGAGLVRVAVPEMCLDIVASYHPCYTTIPLPCDPQGRLTLAAASRLATEVADADAVAFGPGLGRSDDLAQLVERFYDAAPIPMVVDADAINNLARGSQPPRGTSQPPAERLWTPHPGEYRRLTNVEPSAQREHAVEFARSRHVVMLLKGAGTLVTNGAQSWENRTGNPGMATGGSGDVLTGLLAALLAQGLSAWDAARLGAHVHGAAGDLAAAERGQISLIASDIVDHLAGAFLQLAPA
ncbi:MAG: NAD(P)H-hydrate dehydratase [Planctomycetales bacterium]|nr:NAD(P)H-hydrate dehydratase [Planctomycetales bacterium]